MIVSQIDWKFIDGEEGNKSHGYVPNIIYKNKLTSGITIGRGFDLGSKTKSSLIKDYELPIHIVEKLEPYLGVKGQEAIKNLASPSFREKKAEAQGLDRFSLFPNGKSPSFCDPISITGKNGKVLRWEKPLGDFGLELTDAELSTLDDCVKRRFLKVVKGQFDRDASRRGLAGFETLPASIQTALMSICFNMGEYISNRPPNSNESKLWKAFVSREYEKAIAILTEFSDDPKTKSLSARRLREADLIRKGMIGPLSFGSDLLNKLQKYPWLSRLG